MIKFKAILLAERILGPQPKNQIFPRHRIFAERRALAFSYPREKSAYQWSIFLSKFQKPHLAPCFPHHDFTKKK